MAIETTYFTGGTAEARAEDIYNFLNDNGAGVYFDTVELDTSGSYPTITAKIGELTYFTLSLSSASNFNVANTKHYLANGVYYALSNTCRTPVRGYKTSSGLYLTDGYGFDNASRGTVFLSKTASGDPCFVATGGGDTYSNAYAFGDFYNSATYYRTDGTGYLRRAYCYDSSNNVPLFPVTVACPVAFDVGTYTEDIIFTPFSQFGCLVQIIDINGVKYVYDGFVGLKE